MTIAALIALLRTPGAALHTPHPDLPATGVVVFDRHGRVVRLVLFDEILPPAPTPKKEPTANA